jgi:ribosome recycling factor
MSVESIVKETREAMVKALTHLQEVLLGVRTARATPALVDKIRVDYYGTQTPISQLASISIPEARQIVIKPFDASCLGDVGKAIMKSDLGITPQNDGKVLRLQLPPLSGEQREKFAAKVKAMCEDARIAMRNGRRDMNKLADAEKKSGDLTEDENRKAHDQIQEVLKEYEKKLDSVQDKKIAEIMEV